jgi:hypothetical protein
MQISSTNQQPVMKDEPSPNGGISKQTKAVAPVTDDCQRMRQSSEPAHSSEISWLSLIVKVIISET